MTLADLPAQFRLALRRVGQRPPSDLLVISIDRQRMDWWTRWKANGQPASYELQKRFQVSTSAFGVGQQENSNQTPLGLHRVARKIGGGLPIGTVFRSRVPVGFTWQGMPEARIVHRILWLQGLEPGLNRGGTVDSFDRYIYIHGFGDESTIGRPTSHGCIHMRAADLIPLFDRIREGTLVWISNS